MMVASQHCALSPPLNSSLRRRRFLEEDEIRSADTEWLARSHRNLHAYNDTITIERAAYTRIATAIACSDERFVYVRAQALVDHW